LFEIPAIHSTTNFVGDLPDLAVQGGTLLGSSHWIVFLSCGCGLFESVGLGFGLYRLGCLLQESVQVALFEESVSIGWVPMHRDIAMGCPFANRVLGYA
jgi:hypothetical protein